MTDTNLNRPTDTPGPGDRAEVLRLLRRAEHDRASMECGLARLVEVVERMSGELRPMRARLDVIERGSSGSDPAGCPGPDDWLTADRVLADSGWTKVLTGHRLTRLPATLPADPIRQELRFDRSVRRYRLGDLQAAFAGLSDNPDSAESQAAFPTERERRESERRWERGLGRARDAADCPDDTEPASRTSPIVDPEPVAQVKAHPRPDRPLDPPPTPGPVDDNTGFDDDEID